MQVKYSKHELFESPNADDKLWRYMTFPKFVSLLEKRALFFSRADKLGDPFEGSYPIANVKKRQNELFYQILSTSFKEVRKFILLNCWNLSEHESAALWKLYAKDDEGVAIQTTFQRLKEAFGVEGTIPVLIGKVNYIDFTRESFDEHNCFFTPFLHKMKSFEYEHEVRALISSIPKGMMDIKKWKITSAIFDAGTFVNIDPSTLIENVYITPTAQELFKDLVGSTIEKYGLKLKPHWTDLHSTPIY